MPCIFVHLRSGRPRPFFGCVWIFGKTGQIAFSRVFFAIFCNFSHFAQNRGLWSGHFFWKKNRTFAKSYMRGMAEFRFFFGFRFFTKRKKNNFFFKTLLSWYVFFKNTFFVEKNVFFGRTWFFPKTCFPKIAIFAYKSWGNPCYPLKNRLLKRGKR